ncbi:hypothetical protein PIB30_056713, partial [Stylosanthes scabra]|nr:hypothetical protein [Stylosanthes scabra]
MEPASNSATSTHLPPPQVVAGVDLIKGDDTLVPVFDYQQNRRVGYKAIKSTASGVVIVCHYLGSTLSQIFITHRINNSFVSSFREAIYKLKCRSESPDGYSSSAFQGNEAQTDNFIEMYLRPPSASEEARINDWIEVRQSGIRYYLSLGDQRIVDKNFIIRPKAEFE